MDISVLYRTDALCFGFGCWGLLHQLRASQNYKYRATKSKKERKQEPGSLGHASNKFYSRLILWQNNLLGTSPWRQCGILVPEKVRVYAW